MDAVFRSWRDSGLVWLPERGMGFYPVREAPYNHAYFEKYAEYAATQLGRRLNHLRMQLVDRYAPVGSLVDVGIGCGSFISELRAIGRDDAFGFDINPAGVEFLHDRGWFLSPLHRQVDHATFWDVLEHIHDPGPLLANIRCTAIVTIPVFTGPEHVLTSKHFRKDEHCWYWSRDGFIAWMAGHGFACVDHNTAESLAGREDAGTFVFRRSLAKTADPDLELLPT